MLPPRSQRFEVAMVRGNDDGAVKAGEREDVVILRTLAERLHLHRPRSGVARRFGHAHERLAAALVNQQVHAR